MKQKAEVQKDWNLLRDGLLWKVVVKGAVDQEAFSKQAEAFVKQLQEAAKPKNALEGLLLDRMASSYLRKMMLLEYEAGAKDFCQRTALNEELWANPPGLIFETMPLGPSVMRC